MATLIRPELSENNKYFIEKHRYYELKHFCLQYPIWKTTYNAYDGLIPAAIFDRIPSGNFHTDLTAKYAAKRIEYKDKIDLIEQTAVATDEDLYPYILKGVTEGVSYNYLRNRLDMPCGRDMYYDRYRKFFWLLDNSRK